MIRTIHAYKFVTKNTTLSRRWSERLGRGRAVDVYWSGENHNWIVTKKGSDDIFFEYATGHDIHYEGPNGLLTCWQKHEYGLRLSKEIDLRKIAIMAEKEKKHTDTKKENKYALSQGASYEYEGKHNVSLGVDHALR